MLRKLTTEDKQRFFLVEIEDRNFFVKDFGKMYYGVEEGVEDASMFTQEEAQEIMDDNPGRFEMVPVGELINEEEYEVKERQ